MDEVRHQLRTVHAKLDVLIKNGRPSAITEYMSVKTAIILIVIGIISAIWAEYLIIYLGIKDNKRPWVILLISVMSIVVIFILRRLINK